MVGKGSKYVYTYFGDTPNPARGCALDPPLDDDFGNTPNPARGCALDPPLDDDFGGTPNPARGCALDPLGDVND